MLSQTTQLRPKAPVRIREGAQNLVEPILSGSPVLYPYVTQPDVLVVISQETYPRFAPDVKPVGMLIVEEDIVRPGGDAAVCASRVRATRLAERLGKRMVLNVLIVGFFGAMTGLVSPAAVRQAVADSAPAGTRDLNLRTFQTGYEYGASLQASVPQTVH